MLEHWQHFRDVCPHCEKISSYKCLDLTSVQGSSKRIILQCGHCRQTYKTMAPCAASYARDRVKVCTGLKVIYPGFTD